MARRSSRPRYDRYGRYINKYGQVTYSSRYKKGERPKKKYKRPTKLQEELGSIDLYERWY